MRDSEILRTIRYVDIELSTYLFCSFYILKAAAYFFRALTTWAKVENNLIHFIPSFALRCFNRLAREILVPFMRFVGNLRIN